LESNLLNHGVSNIFELEEVKNKIKETNMDKYGVEFIILNDDFKKRINESIFNKYGVNNVSQNKLIKDKKKETTLKHYGVENVSQDPIIKKNKLKKQLYTMYNNGTAPCSKQQKYLQIILNGYLNYPVENCSLDIAFPEEKIYIEYDGSGHDLRTKFGDVTILEFKNKEITRHSYLKNKGWKQIRLISKNDILPYNDIILQLIKRAKKYLNQGHSWFEINIDESKLKCSQYKIDYDFGELRKIKKKDII
jgi:very-short-patch-repair endonuclease